MTGCRWIALALAFVRIMVAQDASLSGRVTDPGGLPVPGAIVTVSEHGTGLQLFGKTDGSGLYAFPDLRPGNYDVRVAAPGFASQVRRDLVLDVAQQVREDFALGLGQTSQSLEVSAGVDRLQTADASLSTVVERQLTENMPLNGRSFQNLITLAPGVNLANAQNSNGQFVVNGLRASMNSFSIDGINAVSTVTGYQSAGGNNASYNAAGGTNGMVAVDALEEFRVITSSFAPEYGRNPGAHVLLVTRSGTNQFHGTAFDYFRNDKLDAADWFVNQAGQAKPRLRSNDFGGVLGGPVVKNRIFFFVSYEGQRLAQPQFAVTVVPSIAARNSAPPVAQAFLNAFPIPNGAIIENDHALFSAGYSNPLSTNSALLKADQFVNEKWRGFATFTYAPSSRTTRSNSGTASLSNSNVQHLRGRSLTVGLTHMASATVVSDVRVNVSDTMNASRFTMDTFGGAAVPANLLLLPSTSPTNYYSFVNLGDPSGDLFGGSIGNLQQRQFNVVGATSVARRAHQLKFGADYRLLLPVIAAGGDQYFQFNGVAGLLRNQLDAFHLTAPSRDRTKVVNFSLYAQDEWRVFSVVTVTWGVRWDFDSVPRSLDANNGDLVPLLGNYATGDVAIGRAGAPLWRQQYGNVAPRAGAALQLRRRPGRETVLRAGGGLFFDSGIAEASAQPWVSGYPAAQANVLLNSHLPVSPAESILPAVNLVQPPPGNRFFQFAPRLQAPRVWEWNVALEQALGKDQTLTVAYVGSAGRKLLYAVSYPEVTSNIYTVSYTDDSGWSHYQALQMQYERRLRHGLAASAGYTWGHSTDTNSSDTTTYVPGVYQPASSNRGDSDFDIRQSLHGGFSWNLPRASHAKKLTGGWGLDGIAIAQTSLPINVTFRRDIGFGTYDFRPNVVPGVPVWIVNPAVGGGRQINPAAIVAPSAAVQGNLGRNALRGFDLVQMDLSVRREFRVTERANLLFRADLFDALNHPNFANPSSTIGSGLFGISTATVANSQVGGGAFGLNSIFNVGGPRAMQLSLKLRF